MTDETTPAAEAPTNHGEQLQALEELQHRIEEATNVYVRKGTTGDWAMSGEDIKTILAGLEALKQRVG
jgi:hypothetical protein